MGKFTIVIHLLAVAAALLGCARAQAEAGGDKPPAAKAKPAATTQPVKVKITIGKDTTYITGPLNADGTVNYVAYVNAKLSKGVTPRNNAAVLLVRAIGPMVWSEDLRAKAMKLMGISAPPAEGEYFVSLDDYIEHLDEKDRPIMAEGETASDVAEDLLDKTTTRPWSARDYPLVAGWLKANAKPLALVESASRCSHIYFPLIPVDDPPQYMGACVSVGSWTMHAGRALVVRAMLKLSQGRVGEAWGDLMAVRRLARLILRGGTAIEGLIGLLVEDTAYIACKSLIARDGLSAKQVKAFLADLGALRPLRDAHEMFANDRFAGLDAIMAIARTGGRKLPVYMTADEDGRDELFLPPWFSIAIVRTCLDWDEMMRVWNGYFDRWYEKGTMRERELAELRVKVWTNCSGPALLKSRLRALIEPRAKRRKRISKDVAEVLVASLFCSSFGLVRYQRANAAQSDVLHVGAALLVHKAETGRFPAKLAELAPKYLKALPKDRLSGKALIYRQEGKGCIVYSVGKNCIDDAGVDNSDKEDVDPDDEKDDIVIRFKR